MKALVEKEIRLLLPAFAGAIVLAVLPVWLFPYDYYTPRDNSIYFFCFGVALLALSTFGREVGLKTLPFMLAQPVGRARVWRTKSAVLGVFVLITLIGWWLSRVLFSFYILQHLTPMNMRRFVVPSPHWRPEQGLVEVCVRIAVMVAGALWTTLLLRQVVAAFCLTLLLPAVIGLPVRAAGGQEWVVSTILGMYAVAGILLARRQFVGLQDTAWTGGIVTLAAGRPVTFGVSLRERRPWGTLLLKELKLQEFTLAGMAGLFVVHVGVVFLRKLGADSFGRTTLSTLEMFGTVWMFVPLVAGSQSVAEERQLGILDGLLCLPFSRPIQFWTKLIFVLIVGGLLSAVLQRAADSIGQAMGVGKVLGFAGTTQDFESSLYCYLALSLAAFWASTLTRSVVQAMAAGVVISLLFYELCQLSFQVPILWRIVAFPTLLVTILWLVYGNFRWVFESGRRWRRNVLVVSSIMVISLALIYAVTFRVWEFALPVDGVHGPAILPTGSAATVNGYGGTGLAIVLPDGRLWTDRIAYDRGWMSLAGDQFVTGSNWVSATANSRDTVAIRSDGTLWVSEKPRPPWLREEHPPLREHHPLPEPPVPMVRFGVESNWKSVADFYHVTLLKRDGTLWTWGKDDIDSPKYEGLRASSPQRLDANSDWDRIAKGRFNYGWKRDGSAWAVQAEISPSNLCNIEFPDLAGFRPRSFSPYPFGTDIEVCVRDDGTLWCWQAPVLYWRVPNASVTRSRNLRLIQIGGDSDWAVVSGGPNGLFALKTDGSLWHWKLKNAWPRLADLLEGVPRRMGTHNDWIGTTCWYGQNVALAADGNIWCLPGSYVDDGDTDESSHLLAPSRRMSKIENIFGAKE